MTKSVHDPAEKVEGEVMGLPGRGLVVLEPHLVRRLVERHVPAGAAARLVPRVPHPVEDVPFDERAAGLGLLQARQALRGLPSLSLPPRSDSSGVVVSDRTYSALKVGLKHWP